MTENKRLIEPIKPANKIVNPITDDGRIIADENWRRIFKAVDDFQQGRKELPHREQEQEQELFG